MITIEQALKQVPYFKAEYFRWKHDLYFMSTKKRTEEEFLKYINRSSFVPFKRWERTEQYKQLVCILLQAKTGNDLLEMYNSVASKARSGDPKAIETYLKLQKYVNETLKDLEKANKQSKQDEDDELEI
ncbi:MAG: hypothetical protein K6T88_06410 [Bacillus sp. (in: Bacteria)]|nr:hypothetical protein [Bacillus sp. (in: firmicutes)]